MSVFRRKRPPWDDPVVLRAMLVHLLDFVVDELDPDPHSWQSYFTDPAHQFAAGTLARMQLRCDFCHELWIDHSDSEKRSCLADIEARL